MTERIFGRALIAGALVALTGVAGAAPLQVEPTAPYMPVLEDRGNPPQGHKRTGGLQRDLWGRRDLFAPPRQATSPSASYQAPLPQIPSVGGQPLPPATPFPLPPLGGPLSQPSAAATPLPRLVAIVLGPTPQAVFRSDRTYTIVYAGEHTPWGTVSTIRSSAVVFTTASSSQTISWSTGDLK